MFSRTKRGPAATIHERFEHHVTLRPRAIALECDGVQLTYREVNQDANRMARRLASARVGTDGLVVISMERSCELVITLLAVMKAGGAFVLTPSALSTRQWDEFMKTTAAEVVVTDSICRPVPKQLRVVRYYAVSGNDANLNQATQGDRWACVVAGKARSHETVLQLLDDASHQQQFQAGDGMFTATDLTGQAALDLFLPLITGGRLVLAAQQDLREPQRLQAAIQAANCKFIRLPKTETLTLVRSAAASA